MTPEIPQLYPDQADWLENLRGAFRRGFSSPLGVLPTGGGKTVVFSYLAGKLVSNRKRVVLIAHREELIDQISRTLSRFQVRHGMVTAGALYDRRLLAHVASILTLVRRLDRVEIPDYVIIDEAKHCIVDSAYGKVLTYWLTKNPKLRIIGVDATPKRLSGEGLGVGYGGFFDEMVIGLYPRDLINMGRLSEYRLFAPQSAVDLSGVGKQAGDFKKGEAAEVMGKPKIVGETISEYRRLLNGAPTVSFEVSVKNAYEMAEKFKAAGFRAACLEGKLDKAVRRQMTEDFSRGQINVLTSCDIVSEGYDIPGMIGAILRRPTWSEAMHLQQVGRPLRVAPGKVEAIIMDQVNNTGRHGLPCDRREWSLSGDASSKKKSESEDACRQCQKCYAISPAFAAKCRECGIQFPIKTRNIEEEAGQLSEVEVARIKRDAVRERAAAQTMEDLIRLGESRSYRNPAKWAAAIFDARKKKGAANG